MAKLLRHCPFIGYKLQKTKQSTPLPPSFKSGLFAVSCRYWLINSSPLLHGGGGHGEGNKASFFPFEFGLTKSAMQANHSAVLPNLINLYLLQSWLLMNLFPCQESCNKSRVEKIETYTLEWNPFCQQVLLA